MSKDIKYIYTYFKYKQTLDITSNRQITYDNTRGSVTTFLQGMNTVKVIGLVRFTKLRVLMGHRQLLILNGPTCTHALFQGKGGSVKATTCGFDRGLRVSRFEFTWIDHTVTPPLANRINISYSDSKTFPKRICILRVTLLCINHNPGVISRPLTSFLPTNQYS